MPRRTVELSPLARDDWRDIWDYSIQTWSVTTAEDYYNRIADRLDALAADQLIGLPVFNYPGTLKSLIGSHAIYFQLGPTTLKVVRILHHGMDVGKNL